jgi:hypothetical protein
MRGAWTGRAGGFCCRMKCCCAARRNQKGFTSASLRWVAVMRYWLDLVVSIRLCIIFMNYSLHNILFVVGRNDNSEAGRSDRAGTAHFPLRLTCLVESNRVGEILRITRKWTVRIRVQMTRNRCHLRPDRHAVLDTCIYSRPVAGKNSINMKAFPHWFQLIHYKQDLGCFHMDWSALQPRFWLPITL